MLEIILSILIIALLIATIYLILSRAKVLAKNEVLKKQNESVPGLIKKIESDQKEIKFCQERNQSSFIDLQTLKGKLTIAHNEFTQLQKRFVESEEKLEFQAKQKTICNDKNVEYKKSIQNLNSDLNEWNEVVAKLKAIDHTRHPQQLAKVIIEAYGTKK